MLAANDELRYEIALRSSATWVKWCSTNGVLVIDESMSVSNPKFNAVSFTLSCFMVLKSGRLLKILNGVM